MILTSSSLHQLGGVVHSLSLKLHLASYGLASIADHQYYSSVLIRPCHDNCYVLYISSHFSFNGRGNVTPWYDAKVPVAAGTSVLYFIFKKVQSRISTVFDTVLHLYHLL